MKRVDWLVVGAGLVGSVLAERLASQQGKKVLVVERRGHLGGNVHDQLDAHGVWIHSYGPHLFHTNSDRVWNYLSQFTGWKTYEHRVLGWIDGQYVPIPFNFTAIERLFPSQKADLLKEQLRANYGEGARVPVLRLLEEDSPELQEFGQYVFDKVYAGYTTKQWGLLPDQLDASVLGRVPVVVGYDDRYFVDRYQALPQGGYTRMIERMLDQPGIEVNCLRNCPDEHSLCGGGNLPATAHDRGLPQWVTAADPATRPYRGGRECFGGWHPRVSA